MLQLDPLDWTLTRALREQVKVREATTYCTFRDGTSCTFGELEAVSDAFAAGLAAQGVGPGQRVLIRARNRLEFLIAFYGVQKRRAILVPINTELRGDLLAHQVESSAPTAFITDSELTDGDEAIFGSIQTWVLIGELTARRHHSTFDELCSARDDSAVLDPRADDTCLILYTSGTSGASKGVLVPQAHAFLFGTQQARVLAVTARDTFFVALPMFHVNALLMSLGSCLVTGASAYVVDRFSASQWLIQVRTSGATVTNMLGVMAEFILKQPSTTSDRDHQLTRVMAVPALEAWANAVEERFGIKLFQVYGMTECNIVSFSLPGDELIPGRIGPTNVDYFEVAVLDAETSQPCPVGSIGEIVVRPKIPFCFMQGYFGLPDVTVSSWQGLWFHTGDAGKRDHDGYLYFMDRMGDCIRRRGENISSVEIENVLCKRQDIAEAAVVGVKVDGAGGEDEIKAVVVPFRHIDPAELLAWCESMLPRYAVPRFFEFASGLEKTETGKIKKQLLRQSGINPRTWDRETGAAGEIVPPRGGR